MEVLEVVDLSNLRGMTAIDASFTFPNKSAPGKDTAIIIFRDESKHPFLVYIDKMDSNVTLSSVQDDFYSTFDKLPRMSFEYSNKIIVDNEKGIVFRLIDLDPPKPMTKEQIEKILGYKINIVT
jgi:hypothetical protein